MKRKESTLFFSGKTKLFIICSTPEHSLVKAGGKLSHCYWWWYPAAKSLFYFYCYCKCQVVLIQRRNCLEGKINSFLIPCLPKHNTRTFLNALSESEEVTSQSNTFSIGIFLKLKVLKGLSSYTGVNTVYKKDLLVKWFVRPTWCNNYDLLINH